MENKTGSRTDPWGMPHFSSTDDDFLPATDTCWYLEDRYDATQSSARSLRPILVSSCLSSIIWSTVLKAAERSRRTKKADCFQSKAINKSFKTQVKAVSVEWNFRYAD